MNRYEYLLDLPVVMLPFSVRLKSILRKSNYVTLRELDEFGIDDLFKNKCFGVSSFEEIGRFLATYGFSLPGEPAVEPPLLPPPPPVISPLPEGSSWLTGPAFAELCRLFARDPRHHLALPLAVLDLCVRTEEWLTSHAITTVQDLLIHSEDDLWLIGLDDDLPPDAVSRHLAELQPRLSVFGLSLRADRPSVRRLSNPLVPSMSLPAYRIDEFPLRAQTVLRLREDGIRTLGDLAARGAELAARATSWPRECLAQLQALLALLHYDPMLSPSPRN